jgi:tripartite-type tricarboxylate transporter receptor subunit TctC
VQRRLASSLAAALVLLAGAPSAAAQAFPTRPIRMVVPFAPGGPTDTVGRIVAHKLSERLGVNVVVDNRPGATGMIGTDLVAKSVPDGHTLLLCSNSVLVTGPILYKAAYDPRRDIAPISLVVNVPYLLLVHPASGIGSVKDFLERARAKPGTLNYGSAGSGSTSHLAAALFGQMAGVELVHVPYKGSALAATDLIGGHLQFIFEAAAAGMQYVKNGRLRALGISTAARSPLLPDLPTLSEAGVPGYEVSVWHGICAAGATPPALLARLQREIAAGVTASDARDRLVGIGAEIVAGTPDAFRRIVQEDIVRWEKLLRSGSIRIN